MGILVLSRIAFANGHTHAVWRCMMSAPQFVAASDAARTEPYGEIWKKGTPSGPMIG